MNHYQLWCDHNWHMQGCNWGFYFTSMIFQCKYGGCNSMAIFTVSRCLLRLKRHSMLHFSFSSRETGKLNAFLLLGSKYNLLKQFSSFFHSVVGIPKCWATRAWNVVWSFSLFISIFFNLIRSVFSGHMKVYYFKPGRIYWLVCVKPLPNSNYIGRTS